MPVQTNNEQVYPFSHTGYELTDEDMDACVASGLSSEKATNGQWRISVDPGVKDGQTNITQLKVGKILQV